MMPSEDSFINPAFLPFENNIYDVDGLVSLIDDLTLIERALFRQKEGTISQKARDFITGNLLSLFDQIEKSGLEPTGDAKQLKFIKSLIEHLKNLSVVRITIAFEPTNSFVLKLGSQISSLCGKKVLLDIIINQYVVGGAIFEYKGRASRQTLDLKLEEVLLGSVGMGESIDR